MFVLFILLIILFYLLYMLYLCQKKNFIQQQQKQFILRHGHGGIH